MSRDRIGPLLPPANTPEPKGLLMTSPVVGVVVPAPGVPTKQDTVEALRQASVALKSAYPAISERLWEAVEAVKVLLVHAQAVQENLEFYKRRESYFVQKLRVADAGQYRADWDSPLELVKGILDIARELQFTPCTCNTYKGEKQTCVWCRLRTALEALDRRGL